MEKSISRGSSRPESALPNPAARRGRSGRFFDAFSTTAFVVLGLAYFEHVAAAGRALECVAWIALFALPGFLAADLAAGFLHWFADRFFAPSTPLLGRALIEAFREHHRDPGGIARRGIVEASGMNCFACIGILSLGLFIDTATPTGRAAGIALLWFALAIALTNLFHLWAHAERVPRAVAALQRHGWILSPERHAQHHSGAHDRAFCVTTGWLNPFLDGIQFFGRLERAVRRLRRSPPAPKLAKGTRAN